MLENPGFNVFAGLFSVALVCIFFGIIYLSLCSWKSLSSRSSKLSAIFITAVYLAVFVIQFPGLVESDDCIMLRKLVMFGMPSDWLGICYSLINAAGYLLIRNLGIIPIINLLLFSHLMLKSLQRIEFLFASNSKHLKISLFIFTLLLLSPVHFSQVFVHARDTTAHLLILLICTYALSEAPFRTKRRLVIFAATLMLISTLKVDNRLYLLLIPLVLVCLKRLSLKAAFAVVAVNALFMFIVSASINHYFNFPAFSPLYNSSSYLLPLAEVSREVQVANIPDTYKTPMQKVIDLDKHILMNSGFNLDASAIKKNADGTPAATEQDWNEFQHAVSGFLAEHPITYLQSRNKFFFALSGLTSGPTYYVSDNLRLHRPEKCESELKSINLNTPQLVDRTMTESFLNKLITLLDLPLFKFSGLGGLFLGFLFITLCLAQPMRSPPLFWFSWLVIAKLVICYFAAPAVLFKYVYIGYLYPVFFFPDFLASFLNKGAAYAQRASRSIQ